MRSVTVVSLRYVFLLAAFGLLSAISTGVSAQSVTATLPKVNFLSLPAGPYPSAPQTVGNFTYVPPPTITAATISGTLGWTLMTRRRQNQPRIAATIAKQ